ncbi:MAG: creatininase family protein [Acidimicrobiia bacterium]
MTAYHQPLQRRLELLTSPEVRAIDKASAIVVQPIASVEQHGPHLPCATDTIMAEALTDRAIALTPTHVNVWRLPVMAYGKSTEHLGYPGTITLTTETLLAVCNDIGRSVAASGFRKLVFVNGHGGQPQLLETVARDIRERYGLLVFPLTPYRLGIPDGLISSPDELNYGLHGGEMETSVLMALAPDLVRADRLVSGSTALKDIYEPLRYLSLEGALPTAWLSRDLAPNGVPGDPRLATAAKGEVMVKHWTSNLAGVFAEIAAFEFTRHTAITPARATLAPNL